MHEAVIVSITLKRKVNTKKEKLPFIVICKFNTHEMFVIVYCILYCYLFVVLCHAFTVVLSTHNSHTGSLKGTVSQDIQLVMYCKLLTSGWQLQAFPLEVGPEFKLRSQRW